MKSNGNGFRANIAVSCSHNYCAYHEQPIDPRDVDLSVEDLRRVNNLDLGKVGQLDDLRK